MPGWPAMVATALVAPRHRRGSWAEDRPRKATNQEKGTMIASLLGETLSLHYTEVLPCHEAVCRACAARPFFSS